MGKAFGTSKTISYIRDDHPIHAWKSQVAYAGSQARPKDWKLSEPMQVSLLLILSLDPRLKAATVKPVSRIPACGPRSYIGDVDNYTKAILDALNGVLFADDVQIWGLWVKKVYCGPDEWPRAVVKILSGIDSSEIPS
jgi:Holliday junction resolvase RusA-like endonuclease